MKVISFIQPVESMRGSFGNKQDLRYAENDNKAFESPDGKVNFARNYQPTFIGAKVARTGLKYFAVKTKSAIKNTAAWRLLAALMGAMSAIYGWVLKQTAIFDQLMAQYTLAVQAGYDGTFHKWVGAGIRASLAAKAATITVVGPTETVTLGNNPFSNAANAITISSKNLSKFWTALTPGGVSFYIDDKQAIMLQEGGLQQVLNTARINILGLDAQEAGSGVYIKIGDKYIVDANGVYLQMSRKPNQGERFYTVETAPSD